MIVVNPRRRALAGSNWKRSLETLIGNNDLWIGAHAMALDVTLAKSNEREFKRIGELSREN
jgi:predicted nucleic acid-binding protein